MGEVAPQILGQQLRGAVAVLRQFLKSFRDDVVQIASQGAFAPQILGELRSAWGIRLESGPRELGHGLSLGSKWVSADEQHK